MCVCAPPISGFRPVRRIASSLTRPLANARFARSNRDDFTVQLDTNLTSLYFVTIAFLPLLKKSTDDPSVVNIASIAAWNLSPSYSSTSYGASKAGALQITKVLAARLAPFGIRTNAICPGIFPR